jgi:hypothetical protein
VSYLGCGYYVASKQGDYGWFTVARFSDISALPRRGRALPLRGRGEDYSIVDEIPVVWK